MEGKWLIADVFEKKSGMKGNQKIPLPVSEENAVGPEGVEPPTYWV